MVSDGIPLYIFIETISHIDKQNQIRLQTMFFSSVGDYTVDYSFFWTVSLSSCSSDPSPIISSHVVFTKSCVVTR